MHRHRLLQVLLIVLVLAQFAAPAVSARDARPGAALPRQVAAQAEPPATEASAASAIRINEVLFRPAGGGFEWVELKNNGAAAVSLRGYRITDEDDHWYRIPAALPSVPAGAFVVIVFDGLGSSRDDYNFSDNVATLHSAAGLVNIFEDQADQCALYKFAVNAVNFAFLPMILKNHSPWNPPIPFPPTDAPPSPVVGFVAWGAPPGADATPASAAALWSEVWYVGLARGLGDQDPNAMAAPGESIGLRPGAGSGYPDNWILYQANEASQGRENAWPVISWFYPAARAAVDGATFAVSWNAFRGATGYRFQLDNNNDMSSPMTDTVLTQPAYTPTTPVPAGAYFWRVKIIFAGGESPWSAAVEIRSLTLPPLSVGPEALASKTLGITWQLQHKDTNMLCLDGDAETGNQAWDAPHAQRGDHGNRYCVRASMSMMASYYGGHLSQDRITFEMFKGGQPEGDLAHNVGVAAPPDMAETNGLAWSLGVAPATIPAQAGKPTFAQIKAWIDASRPIMTRISGHMRVIDGYWEFTLLSVNWQFIHLLDPWDRAKWVSLADDPIAHVWVGPAGAAGAPAVRSDEDVDHDGIPDTMDDSDGDGVCDFDERNRFASGGHSLDPAKADSDGDLVPDGLDMREYLFSDAGAFQKRNPDVDDDGFRKELDPDNDSKENKGISDGCEDSNHNGKYEPNLGETNNFDAKDDMTLHILLSWPQLGTDVDLHLIRPGGSMNGSGDCYFSNRNPDWGMRGVACDDPRLDVDCIQQCTIENIRLSKLENGTYSVRLHYYSDHGLGPATPRVTVWVQGVQYNFGPQRMTDRQVWSVCTVTWPSKVVGAGGSVTVASADEAAALPVK